MTELSTSKTWYKTHIDVVANEGPTAQSGQSDGDRQNRQLLWEIKEALIGTNGAWTVVRSCGYQSGAWSVGDADYWDTADDVRWADTDSTRSWIILENTGTNYSFRMMIYTYGDKLETERMGVYVSSDAGAWGTGGSSTGAPSNPTNCASMYANYWIPWIEDGEVTKVANVFQSGDGECTRIYISWAGDSVAARLWMVDKPKINTAIPNSIWEVQAVTCFANALDYTSRPESGSGGIFLPETVNDYGERCRTMINGADCKTCFATELIESFSGDAGFYPNSTEVAPDVNGSYLVTPMDYFCARSGYATVLCRVQDLWCAPTALNNGDGFPNDGSKSFIKIGCVIQPNDGTGLILP